MKTSTQEKQQSRPDPNSDLDLKKDMMGLVDKCKDFLTQFIEILEKQNQKAHRNKAGEIDMGANFDRVGMKIVDTTGKKFEKMGMGFAYAAATIEKGVRVITYRPMQTNIAYASNTLTELLHHSAEEGTYGDEMLDNAMKALLGDEEYYKQKEEYKKMLKKVKTDYTVGMMGHRTVKGKCQ